MHITSFCFKRIDLIYFIYLNDVDVQDGWTALHICAKGGHKTVAEMLLQNGADVNLHGQVLS